MKNLLSIPALILLLVICFTCEDPVAPIQNSTDTGVKMYLYNHTGHSPRCGPGLKIRFELRTNDFSQGFTLDPDFRQEISVPIMEGEALTVLVKDASNDQTLLQRSEKYQAIINQPNGSQSIPRIVLCPKDQINFSGF